MIKCKDEMYYVHINPRHSYTYSIYIVWENKESFAELGNFYSMEDMMVAIDFLVDNGGALEYGKFLNNPREELLEAMHKPGVYWGVSSGNLKTPLTSEKVKQRFMNAVKKEREMDNNENK